MSSIDGSTPDLAQPSVPPLVKRREKPAVAFSFANQKGGVGKTATCASIATALAREFAVLTIDLDHQAQLSEDLSILDPSPKHNAGQWLLDDPNSPLGYFERSDLGLDVVASRADVLSAATVSIRADELGGLTRLLTRVDLSREMYDFIIIDLPAGLDTLTNVGLAALDVVLPVVSPEYAGWFSCLRFLERVAQVRSRLSPQLLTGPLVKNAFNVSARPPEQQLDVERLIEESGLEVAPFRIARSEFISKARGVLTPAERLYERHPSVHVYRHMATWLVDWFERHDL